MRKMRKILSLFVVCTLFANLSVKSAVFVDKSVTAPSGKHKLLFSVPNDYDATKKYPLVIALHKYGGDALSYRKNLQPITDSLKMIVACPDNSGQGFTDQQFDVIIASIDSAKILYSIDEKSIYFNGMSMNATYVLHEGLKTLFNFKGIFPWAPYQPIIENLNSKVPVVLSIGTADDYGDGATLNLYDSLKAHNANVNLVLLPGIKHTSDFADFGNEMIRCLNYLNDTGLISIKAQGSSLFELINTDSMNLSFKVSHKLSKEITVSSLSSDVTIIPNPKMTYTTEDSTVNLNFKPIKGKTGRVEIILEVREKDGTAIKQITARVKVKNAPVEVLNINMDSNFFIYPNPAADQLFVKSNKNDINGIIDFISLTGQQVQQNIINSQLSYIDISNLKNGLYVMRITTESGFSTQKFIKK
jgi:predicted esterase